MSPRPETTARQKRLEARTLALLAEHCPEAEMRAPFVAVPADRGDLCIDLHVSSHPPTPRRMEQRRAIRDLGCRVIPCHTVKDVEIVLASLGRHRS